MTAARELSPTPSKLRAVMRWLLAAFFAAAGYAHLAAPQSLLAITPDWVPYAPQVIFLTACSSSQPRPR